MDKYTANRYIWLKQQIAAGGGSVPQELIDEVESLDTIVNGDETQDPPVVGLVDIVGDLENSVDDLEEVINGDPTAEPPVPPLLAGAGNMRISTLWSNSSPDDAFSPGNISLGTSDYNMCAITFKRAKSATEYITLLYVKGIKHLECFSYPSGSGVSAYYREVSNYDDSTLTIGAGYKGTGTASSSVDNDVMIPITIYGIKFMSN